MEFKVNKYTTIRDFIRLNIFETFLKYGEQEQYEKFNGKLDGRKVTGYISLKDNNIYKLTLLD